MRVSPTSRIIFLSQHTSLQAVSEALAAGGKGYVAKSDAALDLFVAINTVLKGESFVSTAIQKRGWAL